MPPASKKIKEQPPTVEEVKKVEKVEKKKMEKVEEKPKPKPKKEKHMEEEDPKVLQKHLKIKDKEIAKIKLLVEKMVKIIE
jgi:hypothetical protein